MKSDGFRDLVVRAQEGNAQAAGDLLAIARPCLEQLCGHVATNGADSDSDIVQVAALQAWQNLHQFHGASDDEQTFRMFRAWLATIVQRVMANDVRYKLRQRRHPQQGIVALPGLDSATHGVDPPADEPTPSTRAQDCEVARLVRAAVDKIPDDIDRRIVHLRFFEALSLREIAPRVGITYDQARERYRRSMASLELELAYLL